MLLLFVVGTIIGRLYASDPEVIDTEPFDIDIFGHDDANNIFSQKTTVAPIKLHAIPNSNLPKQKCENENDLPSFVKLSKLQTSSTPKIVRSMESLAECVSICRQQLDPNEQSFFNCHGFIFTHKSSSNACQFFDETPSIMPIGMETKLEERSTFFERLCLALPSHCSETAYSFEALTMKKLEAKTITEFRAKNKKECLDSCLTNSLCKAVNLGKKDNICQLLEQTLKNIPIGLIDDSNFDYYENTCIQEKQRCEHNQRVDFIVSKNSEVSGLDLSLGSLSIKNCMRECVESTMLFCRSFQYDPSSRECILMEESSVSVSKSETLDLYEPICLDHEIDLPCSGDYVFEKVHHMNLVTEDIISIIQDSTVENCMQICLKEEKCLAFTYSKIERKCKILPLNRRNNQTRAIVETFFDFYELSCDRNSILKNERITSESTVTSEPAVTSESSDGHRDRDFNNFKDSRNFKDSKDSEALSRNPEVNACDMNHSVLIDKGRTLRIEYRNLHHINIKTLESCEELCQHTTINCQTFAYNERTGDCLLSTLLVDKNKRFLFVTQPNPSYMLYAFVGRACNYNTTTTTSFPKLVTSGRKTTDLQHSIHEFTVTMELQEEVSTTYDPIDSDPFDPHNRHKSLVKHHKHPNHHNHHDNYNHTKTEDNHSKHDNSVTTVKNESQSHTTTVSTVTVKSSASDSFSSTVESLNDPKLEDFGAFPAPPDDKTVVLTKDVYDQKDKKVYKEEKEEKNTVKEDKTVDLPRRDKTLEKLQANQITVKALCLEKGVNVTFTTKEKKYNGAVYAAERFGQCRVFVDMSSDFSIFISRPSVNNYCNALEEDGVLTAVLVLSNDMVLPYDVTTKEDFFYQITCDYQQGEHASIVRTGIVVGGPEPKSVMTKKDETETKVILRILKNHRPVTNVYIGEKLTAVVESDIDASHLRVTDCNATRVGGREPKPNSVKLVQDGCSLMPQIMGSLIRGPHGLEAPFTAFRIDGSDQIDIVCSVIVCKEKCDDKDHTCPSTRPKRAVDQRRGDDQITVDQRLRVLVVDDNSANDYGGYNKNVLSMLLGDKSSCVNPGLLLGTLCMFIFSFVLLAISGTWFFCSRRSSITAYQGVTDVGTTQYYIPRVERFIG